MSMMLSVVFVPSHTSMCRREIFRRWHGYWLVLGYKVDSLCVLPAAGVEWAVSGADALTPEVLDSATQLAGGLSPSSSSSSSSSAAPLRNDVFASAAFNPAAGQELADTGSSSLLDYESSSDSDTDADAQLVSQASWQQQQQQRQTALSDSDTEDLYSSGSDSDTDQEEEDWQGDEAVVEGLLEAAYSSSNWSR
jgi:hypothetical protein